MAPRRGALGKLEVFPEALAGRTGVLDGQPLGQTGLQGRFSHAASEKVLGRRVPPGVDTADIWPDSWRCEPWREDRMICTEPPWLPYYASGPEPGLL